MTSYTISETAHRSGFSPSALRYYEKTGLVVPAGRTGGGYRFYDERSLARLAFIARAKQLGCSLDEIVDLVDIWDGERCGPVQRSFHELVTDKLDSAQRQVLELTAFIDQLRAAADLLSGEPADGPCSDGCACMAAPGPRPAPVTLGSGPADAAPIACTLDPGLLPDRVSAWRALLDGSPVPTATPDGGLRIDFPEGVALGRLCQLVSDEQHCCSFLGFTITVDARGVGLEVRAPASAAGVLADLFGEPA